MSSSQKESAVTSHIRLTGLLIVVVVAVTSERESSFLPCVVNVTANN
jgi:hypothetical protein